VRRLCLECSVRLPGYGRTGTPVNDVEDYRLVVDWPSYTRARLPRSGKLPRYRGPSEPTEPGRQPL